MNCSAQHVRSLWAGGIATFVFVTSVVERTQSFCARLWENGIILLVRAVCVNKKREASLSLNFSRISDVFSQPRQIRK
jgi:hypothetical protein